MTKYLKYAFEVLRAGNFNLFLVLLKYILLKKNPAKDMQISNPTMGKYFCRKNTMDFLYSFFTYEYRIKNKIKYYLKEFDAFIDVGACIGDYSIWMAKNDLKAYAFEPNAEHYESLTKNIQLNQLPVKSFKYGLGSKPKKFISKQTTIQQLNQSSARTHKTSQKQEGEVKIFDEVFQNLDLDYEQSVIMKIGAEGMEAEIIRGAQNFLTNTRKILLIFESNKDSEETLKALGEITPFQQLDMDDLNIGILINN